MICLFSVLEKEPSLDKVPKPAGASHLLRGYMHGSGACTSPRAVTCQTRRRGDATCTALIMLFGAAAC